MRNTPNPAMQDHLDFNESTQLMNRECDTLVSEIERLEMFRGMQEMRLENVIKLVGFFIFRLLSSFLIT